jgi:pimeloyl-ACP methyl ester carboxylesterase
MTAVTYDHPIAPPSKWLLFGEGGRALSEALLTVSLWPLLRLVPRGDGHSVLVLPGLVAADDSTGLLRRYLHYRGYDVHGWGQGRNLGPRPGVEQGMVDLLKKLADDSGRRVSVVGWSLGGIYARQLAEAHPAEVRAIITLGSPFVGSGHATNAWRLYEAVSGRKADESDPTWQAILPTPSMPTTSVYSRTDGVVAWQTSLEKVGPHSENIEVIASHLGLGAHPAVLYAVADRLAQPEDAWKPFERSVFPGWVYPRPAQRA